MTNFFDQNIDAFIKASDYINKWCISFANRSITAPGSSWVFTTLQKSFSECDDAVAAINFDCVMKLDCYEVPCLAEVRTNAEVIFHPKHDEEVTVNE